MLGRRALLLVLAMAMGPLLASCGGGDASGCSDFNPRSDPLALGRSANVTVRVVDGRLGSLDVAGGYWISDDTVALPDGEYEAIAVLTEAVQPGGEGTVLVDLGDHGSVVFTGPIYCM
jgi:hypothetical protein